jgi:DNA polymerase-3 subunit gamma/tau
LTRARTTLNLNSILDKKPEPLTAIAETKIKSNAVSDQLIKQAWDTFAETRKNESAIYILLQRPLEISNTNIQITLTNPVEEPLLQSIKAELLAYLRETLENTSIQLDCVLTQQEHSTIAYTNKEKLEKLSIKYPLIIELKERLGLDTDY